MTEYKQPLTFVLKCDDLDRPLTHLINEASVQITVKPSDDFLKLLQDGKFTQRGKFSWALSTKDNGKAIAKFLRNYGENFVPGTLFSNMETSFLGTSLEVEGALGTSYRYEKQPHALFITEQNRYWPENELFTAAANLLEDFKMPKVKTNDEYLKDAQSFNYGRYNRKTDAQEKLRKRYATLGGVSVELKNDLFWVRLFPVKSLNEDYKSVYLPKMKNVHRSTSAYYPPRKVIEVISKLEKRWGEKSFDEHSDAVFELLEQAKKVVSVGYSPSQPATVLLCRGEHVSAPRRSALLKYKVNEETKVPLKDVLKLQEKMKSIDFLVHPGLTDMVNMTNAKPYMDDPRLKPYQREAVGLHLSTEIGYLQTCSPGMGKTVIQLVAMSVKASRTKNYRGLVVCEANLRTQWAEEAAVWFPEATVVVIKTQEDVDVLADALAEENPVLVITSYAHTLLGYDEREKREEAQRRINAMTYAQKMKFFSEQPIPELTIGSLLVDSKWDDLCADEAVVIRNGTSKQSNFMWTIRKNSKVATALTATPINKSPDDLGRLVSWVRNDKTMFTGVSLAEQYDTATAAGAKKLFQNFGPIIFRRDTSEIAKSLPKVKQEVLLLTPSPAEKALTDAAEKELKRCYMELVAAVEEAEKATQDKSIEQEELKQVKENLKAANGAWLGGTQLARMATSDPAALQHSNSVGAALLAGQGLIAEAMKDEPTKRKAFIEDAQKRILKGQQILVFTSFSTVADLLVTALQENGINAKAYTGKNGSVRDRARKEFQDGKLEVLVCTQAAERGLTLHKASAIYHYDLPWVLEKIIQRTGRSIRIGSENSDVDIVFLIMAGTVEQRMANHLVELGMSASLVMDNSRGVNLKETETANAMSGLMTAMAKTSDNKNMVAFGKLLLGV